MSNLENEVIQLVSEHLNYDKNKITLKSDFINDLGADSLDSVEVIMALEEKYGVSIPDDKAEKLRTVGDLIKYIEENR